jgi:FkbM family methyltransferase
MITRLKRFIKTTIVSCLRVAPLWSYRVISMARLSDEPRTILRGMLVRAQVTRLQDVLARIGYPNELRISRDACFVEVNGLDLNAGLVDRYYKFLGAHPTETEAEKLFNRLKALGIDVKCFVDLGANFGEFSLWFAKHTEATVLAVEPSTENIRIFESNAVRNGIDMARVHLVKKAIADKPGTMQMTVGKSQGNTIVNVAGETETIVTDTLDHCLREHGITNIDALKIDIEGAEPLLQDDLAKWLPVTRCLLIEMGGGLNSSDQYGALVDMLLGEGFVCEWYSEGKRLEPAEVKALLGQGQNDFLFYREAGSASPKS